MTGIEEFHREITAKGYKEVFRNAPSLSLIDVMIGEWLVHSGKRAQIVIATKGMHPLLSSMNVPRSSPQSVSTTTTSSR